MDSTENLIGEILFAWLHTICTPLLFLGPLHPVTPGHPLNPMQWLQVDKSMQNRGVIRLLLAGLGHHSQAGSPDSVDGKRPRVCRSARPCARRGRVAPSLCSSASAVPCSCAWPRSH